MISIEFHEMDPDVRMDLEFIFDKNLRDIVAKYAVYVDCVRVELTKKAVSPEALQTYLLSLPVSQRLHNEDQKLTLMMDTAHELRKCDTIIDIFNLLTTKCSFLNYEIYESIVKKYNIVRDQEELNYHEHLKAYIEKHEFAKFFPYVITKERDPEKLTLMFDVNTTCALAKTKNLKKLVAKLLHLRPSSLHIVDIDDIGQYIKGRDNIEGNHSACVYTYLASYHNYS